MIDAALHFSTWSGLASEEEAPYQKVQEGYSTDEKGKHHWDPDHKPYDDTIAYTDSFILRSSQFVRTLFPFELTPEFLPDGMSRIEYRDYRIRLIKKFIMNYGAVGVSLHMNGKMFASDYDAETRNFTHFYADVWLPANHAVTIIGWDDNIPKEDFSHKTNSKKKTGDTIPKIDGAWIVQNSWGDDWGNEGFFYVSYDSLDFSYLSELGVFTLQDSKTYKYNFQYDGSAQVSYPDKEAVYMPGKEIKAANIFINTTGEPITIDAVGFTEFDENSTEIASIAENEPGSLILITCENESVEGGYLNRRVVFAKPQ